MKKIFVLQDAITKQYFWTYRADTGFGQSLDEARTYETREKAEEGLVEEMDIEPDKFAGRYIEVVELYRIPTN